jgi:hypothetical protein
LNCLDVQCKRRTVDEFAELVSGVGTASRGVGTVCVLPRRKLEEVRFYVNGRWIVVIIGASER